MKSITLTVVICLVCFTATVGQNLSKKTRLFLMAGPTYLNIRGMRFSNNNFVQKGKEKLGYSLGFGLTHHLGKHIFLNTRLLFERKRFGLDYVSYDTAHALIGESKQDFSKYYLTISVIPQFVLGKYFNIGIGFFASEILKSTVDIQSYNQITFGSTLNQTSKYDRGISFTGGYTVPCRHLIFTIQFTGNYGFQNVLAYQTNDPWYFSSYSILFGLSYKIDK